MEKKFVCLLFGLLAIGVVVTGCTEPSKMDQPEVLKIESRTPDLNATEVDYRDSLSLTFNFPILESDIGVSDLFAAYGSDHEAGTPDLSSATLEFSADKRTVTISGIKGWSNLTSGAGPKVVEVMVAEGKIKDIFGNEIHPRKVLWKFTLGGRGVFSVYPADGATGVPLITQIKATFSEDMDASTINTNTFTVSGSDITGAVSYNAATRTAIFSPLPKLEYNHTYVATVAASVKDTHGNELGKSYTWSFTTMTMAIVSGDINGDGYADVIVGAPFAEDIGFSRGQAYVFLGSASISGDKTRADANAIITGGADNDELGRSVSLAGDVNGDGYADVIVGAYQADGGGFNKGKAYIYYGSGSFSGNKTPADADVTITGGSDSDELGNSVSSAGDVNGDGYADVIVGAHFVDDGGDDKGAAYIYYGSGSFSGNKTPADADVIIIGGADYDELGGSVSSAGDVNGDNYADIVVGADDAGGGRGAAYIYYGSVSFSGNKTPADADVTITGGADDSELGNSVSSAGDVNGDGYADVIIGDYEAIFGTGRAYIYFGGSPMNNTANVTITGTDIIRLGQSVSSAGDVNGDNYADVIIGAPRADTLTKKGKAYIFFGSSGFSGSKTPSDADLTITGKNNDDRLGISVATAGDINRDGYADVMAGAPWFNVSVGEAYIYFGGSSMSSTADVTITGTTGDWVGYSISGDK